MTSMLPPIAHEQIELSGRYLAGQLNMAAAGSAERALWIIPTMALMVVIVLDEGYGLVSEVIAGLEESAHVIAQLPLVLVPLLALAGILGLIVMAPWVHMRAMARLRKLGLEDA